MGWGLFGGGKEAQQKYGGELVKLMMSKSGENRVFFFVLKFTVPGGGVKNRKHFTVKVAN